MHPNLEVTSHGPGPGTTVRVYDDRVEWTVDDAPGGRLCGTFAPFRPPSAPGGARRSRDRRGVVALPTITEVAVRATGRASRVVELTTAGATAAFRVPAGVARLVEQAIRDGMAVSA